MRAKNSSQIIRLLLVGGDDAIAAALERLGDDSETRYIAQRVAKPADVPALAESGAYDALLLDLNPVLKTGLSQAEAAVASLAAYAPVIALTGALEASAEQALQHAGAADCLFGDEITPRTLRRSIRFAATHGGANGRKALPRLFDPATGLATQFLFWEILGLAARRAKRNKDFFALLLLEVAELPLGADGTGNEVMQIAAERVSTVLRGSDTVARFEHSQLAILVESMPRVEDIQIVAEKILLELGKPYPLTGADHHCSINLGISLFPTSAENADLLIDKAFEALAHSKSRGKDRYVFA